MSYIKRLLILVLLADLFAKAYLYAWGYVAMTTSGAKAMVLPAFLVAIAGATFLARERKFNDGTLIRYILFAATGLAVALLSPLLLFAELAVVGGWFGKSWLAWIIAAVVETTMIFLLIYPPQVKRRG